MICEQSSGKHGTSRLKQSMARLDCTMRAKSAANQPSAVSSRSERVESPVVLRWPVLAMVRSLRRFVHTALFVLSLLCLPFDVTGPALPCLA